MAQNQGGQSAGGTANRSNDEQRRRAPADQNRDNEALDENELSAGGGSANQAGGKPGQSRPSQQAGSSQSQSGSRGNQQSVQPGQGKQSSPQGSQSQDDRGDRH